MKKYLVTFLSKAEQDIIDIYFYISKQLENEPAALKIVGRLIIKCKKLSTFPKEYPVKTVIMGKELRFAHVGKYVIIFYVDNKKSQVKIVAIKYARIDLTKIKF